MVTEDTLAQYLNALLQGNRKDARAVIEQALQAGTTANSVYLDVIWPIMVEIEKLNREERITPIHEHLATRINRTIVDQLQNKLPRKQAKSKKIAVFCSNEELQELGAQMLADLFESDGWDVKFLGGGLTNDDVLAFVNEFGPDILLIYGTSPKQAPRLRKLFDTIKNVNAWPYMRIMVSGGLFNRADGLWEEMGADLFAATAQQAIEAASSEKSMHTEKHRTIKRRKRKIEKIEEETLQPISIE